MEAILARRDARRGRSCRGACRAAASRRRTAACPRPCRRSRGAPGDCPTTRNRAPGVGAVAAAAVVRCIGRRVMGTPSAACRGVVLDGVEDLGVAGAAAQVADQRLRGSRRALGRGSRSQQRRRGEQHARRAEAALRGAARAGSAPAAGAGLAVAGDRPRRVSERGPSAWTARRRQALTGSPSSRTVQVPHTPSPQP